MIKKTIFLILTLLLAMAASTLMLRFEDKGVFSYLSNYQSKKNNTRHKLALLEGELATMREQQERIEYEQTRIDKIQKKLDEILSQSAEWENAPNSEERTRSLLPLMEKLRTIEDEVQKRHALARYGLRLIELSHEGKPFLAPLMALKAEGIGGQGENWTLLLQYASIGVASLLVLEKGFQENIPAALAINPKTAKGFWEEVLAWLRSQISLRPIGVSEGDNTADILARMEVALAENRLEQVLFQAKSLPPITYELMEPWLLRVETRVKILNALANLVAE